jgi:hypothetical protein
VVPAVVLNVHGVAPLTLLSREAEPDQAGTAGTFG